MPTADDPAEPARPLRIAVVNDYEVVVAGLARMLAPYADRVEVVELDANAPVGADVDIALYDTFAQGPGPEVRGEEVLADCRAQRLVLYGWDAEDRSADTGLDVDVAAYLSKRLPAPDLVTALERVAAGTWQATEGPTGEDAATPTSTAWPGQSLGLSERESEVLALIVQGLSNQEVAERSYLSINTVKSYIRTGYRKIGATSRSQAVLWGVDHGFRPDRVRTRLRDEDDADI